MNSCGWRKFMHMRYAKLRTFRCSKSCSYISLVLLWTSIRYGLEWKLIEIDFPWIRKKHIDERFSFFKDCHRFLMDYLTIQSFFFFVYQEENNDNCKRFFNIVHLIFQSLNYFTGERLCILIHAQHSK